jgi:hypothetical protein
MESVADCFDHGRVGQSRHAGLRFGVRGLAAAVGLALGASVVAGCGSAPAPGVTQLENVAQITVITPDGVSSAGYSGEYLRAGDVLVTGSAGGAILQTGSRQVWLGPSARLTLVDGADQVLSAGAVVVNALVGPALHVRVDGFEVRTPSGAAVRIERGYAIRVGVLIGRALVAGGGLSATVPALHQILATGLALPAGPAPPLQLTDDAAERAVDPQLVADDLGLRAEATGLDAPSLHGLRRAIEATVFRISGAFVTAPADAVSETVLPLLIAQTARGSGSLASRYAEARSLRAAGGSWGVIAHLLGTTALRAAGALQTLFGGLLAVATNPSTSVVGGGTAPVVNAAGPAPTPAPSLAGATASSRPPAATGQTRPWTSPTPSPSGLLQQLVLTLRKLPGVLSKPTSGLTGHERLHRTTGVFVAVLDGR